MEFQSAQLAEAQRSAFGARGAVGALCAGAGDKVSFSLYDGDPNGIVDSLGGMKGCLHKGRSPLPSLTSPATRHAANGRNSPRASCTGLLLHLNANNAKLGVLV